MSRPSCAPDRGRLRQHVVDLCDRGELPSTRFSSHRKIRRKDLLVITRPDLTYEQEQSLWLHRVVLGALALDPEEVLRTAKENVVRWKQVHRPDGMSVKYLDQWLKTIDAGIDPVIAMLSSVSEQAIELRQNSPFAGVVSDEQRQQALRVFREHWAASHATYGYYAEGIHIDTAALPEGWRAGSSVGI